MFCFIFLPLVNKCLDYEIFDIGATIAINIISFSFISLCLLLKKDGVNGYDVLLKNYRKHKGENHLKSMKITIALLPFIFAFVYFAIWYDNKSIEKSIEKFNEEYIERNKAYITFTNSIVEKYKEAKATGLLDQNKYYNILGR
jgi:hypothetical protein